QPWPPQITPPVTPSANLNEGNTNRVTSRPLLSFTSPHRLLPLRQPPPQLMDQRRRQSMDRNKPSLYLPPFSLSGATTTTKIIPAAAQLSPSRQPARQPLPPPTSSAASNPGENSTTSRRCSTLQQHWQPLEISQRRSNHPNRQTIQPVLSENDGFIGIHPRAEAQSRGLAKQ
ncbi:hypothetical protein FXO38_27813, partial [Capsicum annuum]